MDKEIKETSDKMLNKEDYVPISEDLFDHCLRKSEVKPNHFSIKLGNMVSYNGLPIFRKLTDRDYLNEDEIQ